MIQTTGGADFDFIRQWYGKELPPVLDERFARFAANSLGLAQQITDSVFRIDPNADTAYIDEDSVCWLPGKYFDPEFYTSLGYSPEMHTLVAVAAINGSTIHESSHARYTKPSLRLDKTIIDFTANSLKPEHEAYIRKLFPAMPAGDHVHRWLSVNFRPESTHGARVSSRLQIPIIMMQIVEDLFIEEKFRHEFPNLSPFVEIKNETLLSSDRFDQFSREFFDEPNFELFINLFAFLKNRLLREDELWEHESFKPIVEIIGRSFNIRLTQRERTSIAFDAAIALEKEFEDQMNQDGEGEGEDGDGKPFENMRASKSRQGKNSISGDSKAEAAKSPGEETNDDSEDNVGDDLQADGDEDGNSEADGPSSNTSQAGMMIAQAFEQQVKQAEEKSMSLDNPASLIMSAKGKALLNQVRKPVLIDIGGEKFNRVGSREIILDSRFAKTSRFMRACLEIKHVPGTPQENGTRISKRALSRISMDGKIFEPRTRHGQDKGKPEVVILVDGSGSMFSSRASQFSSQRHGNVSIRLAQEALEAGAGVFESLRSAAIPAALYVHTTDDLDGNGDHPVIYSVASFGMKGHNRRGNAINTINNHERFVRAASVPGNENYDGFAIAEVAGLFSTRQNQKILFVMADGKPNGPSYRGAEAVTHTRSVVNLVRKRGIAVLVVSLTNEVIDDNNAIYGEDYNIIAGGNSLDRIMDEALRRVIVEGKYTLK